MAEAGGRECEESWVKDRVSCRSIEMEGRCESNRGEDKVYPATFDNEEKTGLKLDRRRRRMWVPKKLCTCKKSCRLGLKSNACFSLLKIKSKTIRFKFSSKSYTRLNVLHVPR